MAHDLVTELLQYSSLACFMEIWQLCANLLIPNCLRSNLSYSPLTALELYVKKSKSQVNTTKWRVNTTEWMVIIKIYKKHTVLSDVEELIPPKPILNTTKRKT